MAGGRYSGFLALDDELVPPPVDQRVGALVTHRTAQHRVVPVHRVRRRLGEHPGHNTVGRPADIGERYGERPREPPLRRRPTGRTAVGSHCLGDLHRTVQRVADAGVAGQQRLVEHGGGLRVGRPPERAVVPLEPAHQVYCRPHRRPHRRKEAGVPSHQMVVPDADCDVGTEVAVNVRVDDAALLKLDGPRPVRALRAGRPPIRGPRLVDEAGDRKRHRRLDVVPRIGLAAREPRQRSGRLLHRGDGGTGRADLLRVQQSGHLREWAIHRYRGFSR